MIPTSVHSWHKSASCILDQSASCKNTSVPVVGEHDAAANCKRTFSAHSHDGERTTAQASSGRVQNNSAATASLFRAPEYVYSGPHDVHVRCESACPPVLRRAQQLQTSHVCQCRRPRLRLWCAQRWFPVMHAVITPVSGARAGPHSSLAAHPMCRRWQRGGQPRLPPATSTPLSLHRWGPPSQVL